MTKDRIVMVKRAKPKKVRLPEGEHLLQDINAQLNKELHLKEKDDNLDNVVEVLKAHLAK